MLRRYWDVCATPPSAWANTNRANRKHQSSSSSGERSTPAFNQETTSTKPCARHNSSTAAPLAFGRRKHATPKMLPAFASRWHAHLQRYHIARDSKGRRRPQHRSCHHPQLPACVDQSAKPRVPCLRATKTYSYCFVKYTRTRVSREFLWCYPPEEASPHSGQGSQSVQVPHLLNPS